MKYRIELIQPFLVKLQALHDIIDKCTEFDFMASSILLIYDGDYTLDTQPSVDIRLIDFDHTIIYNNPSLVIDAAGIRFGLSKLISYFRKIYLWNSRPISLISFIHKSSEDDDIDYPVRRYSTSQVRSKIPPYLFKSKYISD